MFKNLTLYRVNNMPALPAGTLEERLMAHRLSDPTGQQAVSNGWVPVSKHEPSLVYADDMNLFIRMGQLERVLPGNVINRETAMRCEEFEKSKGYKPGTKQRRDIKDEVVMTLLPQAFIKESSIGVWLNQSDGWMAIDTSSVSKAEGVSELFSRHADHWSLSVPEPDIQVDQTITGWLAAGRAPEGFEFDDQIELVGLGDRKPSVRYLNHVLSPQELKTHIASGKKVQKIGLVWRDRISLVLESNMQIKKLKFLDLGEDKTDGVNDAEIFQSECAIFAREVIQLLSDLASALGLKVELQKAA